MTALAIVGFLTICAGCFLAGCWVGNRHAARAHREAAERMSRIMGVTYHGGEPHNHDGPPARVSQGRIRNRRNFKLHD